MRPNGQCPNARRCTVTVKTTQNLTKGVLTTESGKVFNVAENLAAVVIVK